MCLYGGIAVQPPQLAPTQRGNLATFPRAGRQAGTQLFHISETHLCSLDSLRKSDEHVSPHQFIELMQLVSPCDL